MTTTMIAERDRTIIGALAECVEACSACAYRCGFGSEGMAACGRLCADCASICELVHTLLSRESPWAASIARVAAQVSTECAAEGEKHDDEVCRACVPVCRAAAKHLQELVER
jgi:hypothetical protein